MDSDTTNTQNSPLPPADGSLPTEALWDSSLISSLVDEIFQGDAAGRVSAASALESVTRRHPELLQRFSNRILDALESARIPEVQASLALVVPRIQQTEGQTSRAVSLLMEVVETDAAATQMAALQALADLAGRHPSVIDRVLPVLKKCADGGPETVRSRCRRLVVLLERSWPRTVRNPYLG